MHIYTLHISTLSVAVNLKKEQCLWVDITGLQLELAIENKTVRRDNNEKDALDRKKERKKKGD